MRAFLTLGLLALAACGGESKALFDQPSGEAGSSFAGSGGLVVAAGSTSEPSDGGDPSEGGAGSGAGASSYAGAEPMAGSSSGGVGQGGAAGELSAGKGGGGSSGGGGKAGSGGGGSAGKGGDGSGGEPPDPEIPEACESCVNNTLYYCEMSTPWPSGQCIRCSDDGIPGNDLYRDCDGPGAEHYVSMNNHDPGFGCETYVGFMGMCPE